jgi:hypothetical protein
MAASFSGMNPTERTFSHTVFQESIGGFTSIPCLKTCMTLIFERGRTFSLSYTTISHLTLTRGLVLL